MLLIVNVHGINGDVECFIAILYTFLQSVTPSVISYTDDR